MEDTSGNFEITRMEILKRIPPVYWVTLNGMVLEIDHFQIHNWKAFRRACIEQLAFAPILPVLRDEAGERLSKAKVWEYHVLPSLNGTAIMVDVPPDNAPLIHELLVGRYDPRRSS